MILEKNSILILTATGVAVLVNPAEVVAWLANKLYEYDIPLRKGEMTMLGSFVRALGIEPGLLFKATFVEVFPVRSHWSILIYRRQNDEHCDIPKRLSRSSPGQ